MGDQLEITTAVCSKVHSAFHPFVVGKMRTSVTGDKFVHVTGEEWRPPHHMVKQLPATLRLSMWSNSYPCNKRGQKRSNLRPQIVWSFAWQRASMKHKNLKKSWEKIAVNLFTQNQLDYLVTVDYCSGYWELDRLHSTESGTVIRKLNAYFARSLSAS